MTPGARAQAAIELLDQIIAAAHEGGAAADTIVQRYFSTRRYAGSKDRRAVRDLVFAAIRACGEAPVSGRAALLLLARDDAALATAFDGSAHAPAPIAENEPVAAPGSAPAWLVERMLTADLNDNEIAALIERAPLDVRINRLLTTPDAIQAEIPGATHIEGLSDALRLPAGTDLARFAGRVEVQDAGSQIVSSAARAEPGMTVIDLCAGAGGKTLALAAAMQNTGRIIAADTDRARLAKLKPRAAAAEVTIAEPVLLDPGREFEALTDWRGAADVVLIDAPCSGTGTWRRNPEARWRLTPDRLERLVETQRRLLQVGAGLVKPDGVLVYVVCSLLDEEGAAQIDAFRARHPRWHVAPLVLPAGRARGPGVRLTPAHDDTDGFFVARLSAPC